MDNSLGQPQTIVLLGGTSDIGLAIVRELLSPASRVVVLCCRDVDAGARAADGLRSDAVTVDVRPFAATDPASHSGLLDGIAADFGDLDVVVLAAGLLGDDDVATVDPLAAYDLAAVNFAGSVSVLVATANVLRAQGHGAIVVLSSVAGERVRAGELGVRRHQGGPRRVRPGPRRPHRRRRRPRARGPSRLRAQLDDRRSEARADVDDARGRGRGGRARPARPPPDRLGPGAAAAGVRRPAPPPRARLASPAARLSTPRLGLADAGEPGCGASGQGRNGSVGFRR